MDSSKELKELIKNTNLRLNQISLNINSKALLCALAQNESSFGKNNNPRFESVYYVGGRYYKNNADLRNAIRTFGKDAACSWSSWQIMYFCAYEFGFNERPSELQNDEIALPYIIKFINNRILKKNPQNLENIFDAYNSGNFKDNIIPKKYIQDGIKWYNFYLKNPI